MNGNEYKKLVGDAAAKNTKSEPTKIEIGLPGGKAEKNARESNRPAVPNSRLCQYCQKPTTYLVVDRPTCQKCYHERLHTHIEAASVKAKRLALSGISERHSKFERFDQLHGPPGYERAVTELGYRVPVLDTVAALVGKRGTGKTQLGCVCVRTRIEAGFAARIVRLDELLTSLKARYGGDGDAEGGWRAEWAAPRLLVIDEIGEVSISDAMRMHTPSLLDERYRRKLPTILIGNVAADRISDVVGSSAVSRIREGGFVIECNWATFRE